ncbi:MAG: MBOAT family protein [Lachnospiraceae bacterium]|nr:MBOAT family protein [Lachnospiraceae bacterium]
MTFVSFAFVVFVAVTAVVYFLVPAKYQWCVLLAASYLFFWFNSGWLLLFLFVATAVAYVTARAVYAVSANGRAYLKEHGQELPKQQRKDYKEKNRKKARRVLMAGIAADLGILLVLKYSGFFVSNANLMLRYAGIQIPGMTFWLPLGISFYTLQAIAYMVDVYRGKYEPDKSFGRFMLFMSFFPQLVQGPIARHDRLAHQLYAAHRFDYRRLTFGVQLVVWGWMKKLILADRVAVAVNQIFDNYSKYTGMILFLGAALYGLQVYADFSGGMDMARGVAWIFGIELELNFVQPYFSKSIEEFWRRWHVTLGGWMRDYVFYPLSLSKAFAAVGRKSRRFLGSFVGKRLPSFLAMFLVYFLVGFWHGAEWKYIAYGVWNGVFITSGILLTEFYDKARQKCGIRSGSVCWRAFQILRTFCLVSLGRIFSRANGLMAALHMFGRMRYRWYDPTFLVDGSLEALGLDHYHWLLVLLFIGILLFADYLHEKGVNIREGIARQHIVFRWLLFYGAVISLLVFGMYGPVYDSVSFIYEKF